jgi:hypothetical protein
VTIHFAYGSNMSRALMLARSPGVKPVGIGKLQGWRFIIMRYGYASVVPCPGRVVHGVLWRLTPRDLAALNAYEALDSGLYRRRMLSVRCNGHLLSALVYIGRSQTTGRPRAGYQDIVLPAARDWNLPPAYIAELERWGPGKRQRRSAPEPEALQ